MEMDLMNGTSGTCLRRRAAGLLLALPLLAALALPAHAAPPDAARYRATLDELARLQTEMLGEIDALKAGLDPQAARPRAAYMADRLDGLRATLTAASIPDTATLRHGGERGAPPYARCIVWRAGEMEDSLQDIATDLALKARGVADAELLPLDRDAVAALGLRKGCPG